MKAQFFEVPLKKSLYDLDSICYRNGFEIYNFYFTKGLEEGKPADPVNTHPVVTHGTYWKTFPLFIY